MHDIFFQSLIFNMEYHSDNPRFTHGSINDYRLVIYLPLFLTVVTKVYPCIFSECDIPRGVPPGSPVVQSMIKD